MKSTSNSSLFDMQLY